MLCILGRGRSQRQEPGASSGLGAVPCVGRILFLEERRDGGYAQVAAGKEIVCRGQKKKAEKGRGSRRTVELTAQPKRM